MRSVRLAGALVLLPLLGLASCAPAPSGEPVVRAPTELRAAPTTLLVSEATYALDVEAWRSFQPITGDPGDPMIAILRVRAADAAEIPGALSIGEVYLVRGDEVVRAVAREEEPRPENARSVDFVVRDGPRWAAGDSIDVIVGITGLDGPMALLRAPRVAIARVD